MLDFYSLFKTLAFRSDPEMIHDFSMDMFSKYPVLGNLLNQFEADNKYRTTSKHLDWSFPVGLAAGLDKNAVAINFFEKLGFGAIEVGTVTPKPQIGNPKPRIWRYPEIETLRNAMGFPGLGMDVVYNNIVNTKRNISLGVNIGKNKWTNGDDAIEDYRVLYKKFCLVADYLVINISSPNTPGLRDLQEGSYIRELLNGVNEVRSNECPLLVKIAPDLSDEQLEETMKQIIDCKMDGVIATNTTIAPEYGPGGVSGKYMINKAEGIRSKVLKLASNEKDFDVIGVGGISNAKDLENFFNEGGKFAQIYTSFIFQGPKVLKELAKAVN